MDLKEQIITTIQRIIKVKYNGTEQAAFREHGIEKGQSKYSKFLNGKTNPQLSTIAELFQAFHLTIRSPLDEETILPVEFNAPIERPDRPDRPEPQRPKTLGAHLVNEEYMAVPLVVRRVAAGNGIIPDDTEVDWIILWRGIDAIRNKTRLSIVRIDNREGMSMQPTLHPGDLVLIDHSAWDPRDFPRGIFLVQMPSGDDMGLAVKRVNMQRKNGRDIIVFYSDNTEYSPDVYDLKVDYDNDLTRAVKGRVIWSWTDMTKK